jgi:acyl transferase domain-containing protein
LDAPDTREDGFSLLPWVLTASSPEGLRERASKVRAQWSEGTRAPDRAASALAREAAPLPHRAVVFGESREELLGGLDALATGVGAAGVLIGEALDPARVAFVFSPLGCEHPGMGLDLLGSRAYRRSLDACGEALSRILDWSLSDALRERPGAPPFARLDVRQPALFAVSVSLAELWRSFGVEPAAVLGHSVGEVAAAASGRALTLTDAARVAATWGRSSMRMEGRGAMASLPLPAAAVDRRLKRSPGRLWVAGINAPSRTAVAGDGEAVEELLAELAREGIHGRSMGIPGPGHSPGMEPVHEWFMDELSGLSPREGTAAFHSATSGGPVPPSSLDARYWSRNLRRPVLFEQAVRSLAAEGCSIFVEIGPHPVLVEAIEETLAERERFVTGTLDQDEPGYLLLSLARSFVHGAEVNWTAVCETLPQLPPGFRVPPAAPHGHEDRAQLERLRSALEGMTATGQEETMRELVRRQLTTILGAKAPAAPDPARSFRDLGLDSKGALALRDRLRRETGVGLAKTAVFDHPTVEALARHLRLVALGPEEGSRPQSVPVVNDEEALSRIDEMDVAALVELSFEPSPGRPSDRR